MSLYSLMMKKIALPSVGLFTESRFWDIFRDLEQSGFSTARAEVESRLRSLLEHAVRRVPFYRERFEAAGVTPGDIQSVDDLKRIPITTKGDIQANFPDRTTDEDQGFKPWRFSTTSGTIERLTVIHDFRKRDYLRATQLFALTAAAGYHAGMKYLEIPPDVCRNVCGTSGSLEPSLLSYVWDNLSPKRLFHPDVVSDLRGLVERQLIFRRVMLPSFDGSGTGQKENSLNDYLRRIDEYNPQVVKALPAYLYMLALHIRERGLKPPKIRGGIMPMGASLSPLMKKTVEEVFDCKVHEDYGCSELGGIGAECGHQSGIHPFNGLFVVEVLKDGRPARDGETGRVVLTDLYSYAMPFIRYDIGDVARVRYGRCGCGADGMRLEVQGRLQDCLTKADGSLAPSDEVMDALLRAAGVRIFQLEALAEDEFDVQVVPDGSGAKPAASVRKALADLLGRKVRVQCRTVDTILPESSGKFRFVKNSGAVRELV